MAWQNSRTREIGAPLGVLGYLVRFGEILGFIAGGVLTPIVLRKLPYCQTCQVYQRTKSLGYFPATVATRRVKKKDLAGQEAYLRENQAAYERGVAWAEEAIALVQQTNSDVLATLIAEQASTKWLTRNNPIRIGVSLESCPRCLCGRLVVIREVRSKDNASSQTTEIGSARIDATFHRRLLTASADAKRRDAIAPLA